MYKLNLYKICSTCNGSGKNNLSIIEEDEELYGVPTDKPINKTINCFDCTNTGPEELVNTLRISEEQLLNGVTIKINAEK